MSAEFGPNPGGHADDCAFKVSGWNCSCEYPKYLDAVESIANQIVADAVDYALQPGGDADWGDWPELPEFVWDDVRERARLLSQRRDHHAVTTAYAALSALATEDA